MQPALPPDDADPWISADSGDESVGAFRPGTEFSRWALGRYLVGQAILTSISDTLLVVALALLAIAAVFEWVVSVTVLAVLVVIVALLVLLLRAALRGVLRRLMNVDHYGPIESRLRKLVSDTSRDVRRELGRIGLPRHVYTLPLLGVRLLGRRRADTMARIRTFDTDRAVPKARLDELYLLLRGALDVPPGSPPPPGSMNA